MKKAAPNSGAAPLVLSSVSRDHTSRRAPSPVVRVVVAVVVVSKYLSMIRPPFGFCVLPEANHLLLAGQCREAATPARRKPLWFPLGGLEWRRENRNNETSVQTTR